MNAADNTHAQRTVAVIGSGSWGTAIARLLGVKGVRVRLWSHGADTPAAINATHHNPRYLRDVELPNVWCTNSYEEACAGAESVVIVTPSSSMRANAQALAPFIGSRTPVVVLSTASPYKFPAAVLSALGQKAGEDEFAVMEELHARTGVPVPKNLAALREKPVRHKDVIGREDMLAYVLEKAGEAEW